MEGEAARLTIRCPGWDVFITGQASRHHSSGWQAACGWELRSAIAFDFYFIFYFLNEPLDILYGMIRMHTIRYLSHTRGFDT